MLVHRTVYFGLPHLFARRALEELVRCRADCFSLAWRKVGSPSWFVWKLCFFARFLRIWSLSLESCLDSDELKSPQKKSA
ncbi:hypothetical protein DPMN_009017 [Dreissena polymorpha]|uniref:Uncharacterized protein n=1 Tax=Dreissena polymorpha TaxID=45954 RepID=A0A9D4RZN9_DREPO|nr:hypothetical protein DPMN_009017 [Dreissena polymorpha]